MSTYTKVEKDTSTYTKSTKADTENGWFITGWFSFGDWFSGLYTKIEKEISAYTKINK